MTGSTPHLSEAQQTLEEVLYAVALNKVRRRPRWFPKRMWRRIADAAIDREIRRLRHQAQALVDLMMGSVRITPTERLTQRRSLLLDNPETLAAARGGFAVVPAANSLGKIKMFTEDGDQALLWAADWMMRAHTAYLAPKQPGERVPRLGEA